MIYHKIFSLLLIVSFLLHASTEYICAVSVDFDFEGNLSTYQDKIIVSLGSGCDTAFTLRNCELRHAAFPFDWVVSDNHEKLILMLDDNFQFFTDIDVYSPLEDPRLSDHPNCLKNNYYDILFYHEGSVLYDWSDLEKYAEQLERLKIKYERRINRFRQLRNYEGEVFFVRNFVSATPEQANRHPELAIELREALRRFFPDLNFTLIIVTYHDIDSSPIRDIENVIEFKLNRSLWTLEYEKMYKTIIP